MRLADGRLRPELPRPGVIPRNVQDLAPSPCTGAVQQVLKTPERKVGALLAGKQCDREEPGTVMPGAQSWPELSICPALVRRKCRARAPRSGGEPGGLAAIHGGRSGDAGHGHCQGQRGV